VPLVGVFTQVGAVQADFDHDGHLDVGTLSIHGAMAIWRGDGHANFTRGPVDFGLGDLPYFPVAVDMDGDHLPDLVTANLLLNDVSVVMNRTPVVLAVPPAGPVRTAGLSIAGTAPSPSRGERMTVAFSLPARGPARLEAFDPAGRRVAVRDLGTLEAGSHRMALTAGPALRARASISCG